MYLYIYLTIIASYLSMYLNITGVADNLTMMTTVTHVWVQWVTMDRTGYTGYLLLI